MNAFGKTLEEIERGGGGWTLREILQQPKIWQDVAARVGEDRDRLRPFVAAHLARESARTLLTGAGTSAFIGHCLAPAIARSHRHEAAAVATTDIVAGPDRYLTQRRPTLLVSFARSGNSPESVAALDLAETQITDLGHLIITCNANGALLKRARLLPKGRALLLPEETHDKAFAMTSSFSSMLLSAALLFDLPQAAGVAALAHGAQFVLDELLMRLERMPLAFERVVYLGANELKGLAQEAALKMLELTDGAVVSVADSPLGFRHGPKTILNRNTLVVVFQSNDPYTRRYDRDLIAELRADGIAGRVLALGAKTGDEDADDLAIPGLAGAADWELCLPFALFAQSLALRQSLAQGLRPDNPNAAGAVSRVVQGVSIYPLVRG